MFMCMDMNNGAAVVDILVEYFVRFVLLRRKATTSRRAFIYSDSFLALSEREKEINFFLFYDKSSSRNYDSNINRQLRTEVCQTLKAPPQLAVSFTSVRGLSNNFSSELQFCVIYWVDVDSEVLSLIFRR